MSLALLAYLSVDTVSNTSSSLGLTHAMKWVMLFPPSASLRRRVSLATPSGRGGGVSSAASEASRV